MNVKYIEKIIVLVNNVWKYDTYIIDSDITENKVKEFILSNDKKYKIKSIRYEFHGGPPMGTVMFNYNEIKGDKKKLCKVIKGIIRKKYKNKKFCEAIKY